MVATIDGTRPKVTSAPLMQPATSPVPRPIAASPGVPMPCAAASPMATDASAMMAATEMSISPAMISSASGNATSARSVKLNVASDSVSTFRKYGEIDANNTNSSTSTSASIVSQRSLSTARVHGVPPRGWCACARAARARQQHGHQDDRRH